VAEGRSELQQLGDAAAKCRLAFTTLEDACDIGGADQRLGEAAGLPGIPVAVANRIQEWQQQLRDLTSATAGMVQIPKGGSVDAFFLSGTECSRREFAAFVGELRNAAQGDTDDARLASIQGRIDGSGLTARGLAQLLRFRPSGDDQLPVDGVSWSQAMAFCRWNGKDLPKAAEWTLAAFGDGKKYTYPWGDGDGNDPQQRNTIHNSLVPVTSGGLSWRSQGRDARLHHLAGNVEEWLWAPVGDTRAQTAGGSCRLRWSATAREVASGKLDDHIKDQPPSFVGFRAVLRPREFPGLAWPR
jgi:formylglycine-generating enzyme required for sulfatase activity